MRELYNKNKLFFGILFLGIIGFLVWYFSTIISFILIAVVVSLLGTPLVKLFDKLHFGKFHFPHVLSVILSMLLLLALFIGFFSFFIPLVVREAQLISSIDMNTLAGHYRNEIDWIETWLIQFGIIKEKLTLLGIIQKLALKLVSIDIFSMVVTDVFSIMGTLFLIFFRYCLFHFFS